MARWRTAQFGKVVDSLRSQCPSDAWDDVLLRYAVLVEKGPACGSLIAKKLKNSKDIWELLGHADNIQPRLLFYFWNAKGLIVFVEAFIKKGNKDYKPAIELAQSRRRLIEHGERQANVIEAFTDKRTPKPSVVH